MKAKGGPPAALAAVPEREKRGGLGVDGDLPGNEFVLAVAMQLASGLAAGRGLQQQVEQALAKLLDGRGTVDDLAAIDVHVVLLALPQRGIGRGLERRRRHAAVRG